MSSDNPARAAYDAKTAALVGRRLAEVRYWDVHDFGNQPRTWDYDDWHHAVMGIEMNTDRGPFSALWTNSFFAYGIEVFETPMADHVVSGDFGPESWDVSSSSRWRDRLDSPITAAQTFWAPISVGPARIGDVEVSPAYDIDVPVALRLDFASGPVWMVAAMPQYSEMRKFFVGGDEIVSVLTAERMRQIGFPDSEFLSAATA